MKHYFKAKLCLSLAISILLSAMFSISSLAITDINNEKPTGNNSYVVSKKTINDPQLEAVTKEEEYIVSLINEMNDDESYITTMQDWEYNLNFLKDNYDLLKKKGNVDMGYVDSYIEAYEYVLLDKNMPKSSNKESIFSVYDRYAAVDYAKEYAEDYNDAEYYNWENYNPGYTFDCANFVSQCLYAGGKLFVGTPGVSDATDFSYWFGKGTTGSTKYYSSTWRGADAFKHFWKANASYEEFDEISSESYNYGWTGYPISLLNSNGRAYHTVIIVGYVPSENDFILAQHSSGDVDARLSEKGFSSFIIYDPS